MCHGTKTRSGKTVRFKSDSPKHANATPYKRQKNKRDYRDYED